MRCIQFHFERWKTFYDRLDVRIKTSVVSDARWTRNTCIIHLNCLFEFIVTLRISWKSTRVFHNGRKRISEFLFRTHCRRKRLKFYDLYGPENPMSGQWGCFECFINISSLILILYADKRLIGSKFSRYIFFIIFNNIRGCFVFSFFHFPTVACDPNARRTFHGYLA